MKTSTDHHHGIGQEIRGVMLFVAAIWVVFLVSRFVSLDQFALVPRAWHGLIGIVTMPFLHASFHHLLSNTLPLVVLLMLLAGAGARSPTIVVTIILLGGALLWLFGRNGTAVQPTAHIGASGLIFGLIVFLILSGMTEGRLVPLLVSALVGLLFGGTLFWGMLPRHGAQISWDGHLCGAVAGAAAVFLWTSPRRRSSSGDSKMTSLVMALTALATSTMVVAGTIDLAACSGPTTESRSTGRSRGAEHAHGWSAEFSIAQGVLTLEVDDVSLLFHGDPSDPGRILIDISQPEHWVV